MLGREHLKTRVNGKGLIQIANQNLPVKINNWAYKLMPRVSMLRSSVLLYGVLPPSPLSPFPPSPSLSSFPPSLLSLPPFSLLLCWGWNVELLISLIPNSDFFKSVSERKTEFQPPSGSVLGGLDLLVLWTRALGVQSACYIIELSFPVSNSLK